MSDRGVDFEQVFETELGGRCAVGDGQSLGIGVTVDVDAALDLLLTTDPVLPPDPLADCWLDLVPDEPPDDWFLESMLPPDDATGDSDADEQSHGCCDEPADLESTEPGPLLALLLDDTDLDRCDDDQVVAAAVAAARLESWAAARKLSAVASLVARAAGWRGVCRDGHAVAGRTVPASRIAAHELGAALDLSPRSAGNLVHFALDLARLPATRNALAGGVIDLAKARMVVDTLRVLDDDAAREVEARVLPAAAGRTWAQLHDPLRRAVLRVDPAAAAERRRRRLGDRKAERFPLPDGMAGLSWTHTAETVDSFWTWLTATAEAARRVDDDRTLDQIRADVLADLGRLGLDEDTTHPDLLPDADADGSLEPSQDEPSQDEPDQDEPDQDEPDQDEPDQDGSPTGPIQAGRGRPRRLPLRQGRRPHIQVVVGIGTLLGLDEEPAELVGYGPITADVARRIAAAGTWRRVLTDPRTGRFDEMSASTYEPPQDLRDHVVARDRTCRGPGCRAPAARCDLDHRVPHPRGPTSPDNLYAACRQFHEDKTLTDTTVTDDGAGGLHVTYPTGRTYHRAADPVLEPPLDVPPF
jgi:hypothetical protein